MLYKIESNTFSAACYDQNSIEELRAALKQRAADKTDCNTWKITPTQWRAEIQTALDALIEKNAA